MLEPGAAVLGFDYGGRRIGVAIGQSITGTATALAVVANGPQGPDWAAIDKLVREWRPARLLIGLPLTLSGDEQAASQAARAFAQALYQRYKIVVDQHDERYSSRAAGLAFAQARSRGEARRKDASLLDAQAARVILEAYLAHIAHPASAVQPDKEA
jgi:putative holliday junction resolvase